MIPRKSVGKEQALQKIRHYCGYQERCHAEVKEKLYSFGLFKGDVEELIAKMIEENYLNEERFAQQFAGGKFRMNQWGRKRIEFELRQKKVSDYCIRKGLKEISDADYRKTLVKLANQKWEQLKEEQNVFTRRKKVSDYLVQKGYEYSYISEVVVSLSTNH
ncbi:MAG TPA: regulatory protein RecX [Flavitalea sp.]|nr:regulatory protein RecX [Flavitalea sp.]